MLTAPCANAQFLLTFVLTSVNGCVLTTVNSTPALLKLRSPSAPPPLPLRSPSAIAQLISFIYLCRKFG